MAWFRKRRVERPAGVPVENPPAPPSVPDEPVSSGRPVHAPAPAVGRAAEPAAAHSASEPTPDRTPSLTSLSGARRVPADEQTAAERSACEPDSGDRAADPEGFFRPGPRTPAVPTPGSDRPGTSTRAAGSADPEATQLMGSVDPDATQTMAAVDPDATQMMAAVDRPQPPDPVAAERARLERERAARKQARLAALEPVLQDNPLTRPAAAPVAAPALAPRRPSTDRWPGSLGLFLLRAVTAFILGVTGLNGLLMNQQALLSTWSNTVLPTQYAGYAALGVSAAQVLLAILLLFGLATRLAGLALAVVMGLILGLVMWGPWSIFDPGVSGFLGQHELLLLAVGLLLLFLGAGGWSIDAMLRHTRDREGMEF